MSQIRWATVFMALALVTAPALAQEESVPLEEKASPAEAPSAEPGEAGAETPAGRVMRAGFTSEIVDREPQDSIKTLSNEYLEIIFFTELGDLDGHTVSHVWEREGVEMARVAFVVDGPRWRVYSAKKLEPGWTGEWTVRVEDDGGRVLRTDSFSYIPAAAKASAGEAMPASEEAKAASEEEKAVTEEAKAASEEEKAVAEEAKAVTEELPASITDE